MDASLDKFYMKANSLNIKFPEVFLSKVAFAVLSALDYLKRKNIMHRDIKPSNILINRDCKIKICDFGISGVMNNSRCQTRERGCRPYMAVSFVKSFCLL
jgi:serine/threonine protein kinase